MYKPRKIPVAKPEFSSELLSVRRVAKLLGVTPRRVRQLDHVLKPGRLDGVRYYDSVAIQRLIANYADVDEREQEEFRLALLRALREEKRPVRLARLCKIVRCDRDYTRRVLYELRPAVEWLTTGTRTLGWALTDLGRKALAEYEAELAAESQGTPQAERPSEA